MLLIQKREVGISLCNLPSGITESHIREIIELTGIFKNDNPQNGDVVVFPKDFNIKVLDSFQNKMGYWMCRAEIKLDTSGFIDEATGVERRLTITECLAVESHILNSFNCGIFINITSLGALAIAMPGPDALFLGDGSMSCYYHRYRSNGRDHRQPFLRIYAEPFKIKSLDAAPKKTFKAPVAAVQSGAAQAKNEEVSINLNFEEAASQPVTPSVSVEEVRTVIAPPVVAVEQEQAISINFEQTQELELEIKV